MRSERDEERIYEIRGDIMLGDKAEDGAQLRPNISMVWRTCTDDGRSRIPVAYGADIFVVV